MMLLFVYPSGRDPDICVADALFGRALPTHAVPGMRQKIIHTHIHNHKVLYMGMQSYD